jgi:RNA polymerase sigma-70 factor (ECF subfamily)
MEPREEHGSVSDAELIRRAQAGDQTAAGALLDRYREALVVFARRRLPLAVQRKASASDVVQDAYLTALARLAEFEDRGDGAFGRWLQQILRFKVREAVRRHAETQRRSVRREVSMRTRSGSVQIPAHDPTASQVAVAGETEAQARRAMEILPAGYREVLRMARQERLTLREIAERTGASREAVKKRYARAMTAFRRAFDDLRGPARGA